MKITQLLSRGGVVSQSKFIDGGDAKDVEDNTKSLKERFEKLKTEETDRKQRYIRLYTLVGISIGA